MKRSRRCNVERSGSDPQKVADELYAAENILLETMAKVSLVSDSLRLMFMEYLDSTYETIGKAGSSIVQQIKDKLAETKSVLSNAQSYIRSQTDKVMGSTAFSIERIAEYAKSTSGRKQEENTQRIEQEPRIETGQDQETLSQTVVSRRERGATTESHTESATVQDTQANDLRMSGMQAMEGTLERRHASVGTEASREQRTSDGVDEADRELLDSIISGFGGQPSACLPGDYTVPDEAVLALPYLYLIRKGFDHKQAIASIAVILNNPQSKEYREAFMFRSIINDRKDGEEWQRSESDSSGEPLPLLRDTR